MVVQFIAAHVDRRSSDGLRFGVEPICTVLSEHGIKIAPSTYYAAVSRPPSARAVQDAAVLIQIRRIHADRKVGRGLYGARKVWAALRRQAAEGVELVAALGPVPRCQVERLMRADGLSGATWCRPPTTTRRDPAANRPADLVERDFSARRPNALWLVDFTYVPTWSGMAFTSFVQDAYSRRIVGWRTAAHMRTDLPLDALEMALWIRERAGDTVDGRLDGLIHHSDAGSQGELNRSSQQPDGWGETWDGQEVGVRRRRDGRSCGRLVGRGPMSDACSGSFGVGLPRGWRARQRLSLAVCQRRSGHAGFVAHPD